MDDGAPTGVGRRASRRWLRWLLILLLILPLAAFGISNLVLGSSYVRAKLAAKIQGRTTLETTIGGASWSPWNGLTFRDVVLQQPAPLRPLIAEPLIDIEKINVQPIWKSVLRGIPDVRSIRLTRPRIVLPIELVSHFAPPQPPPVAQTKPQPEPPLTAATAATAAVPTDPAPIAAAENPQPPPAAGPTPPAPARILLTTPTDFIHLEGASFALVFSGAASPLTEWHGITGSIPVGGRDATSFLDLSKIDFLGNPALTNFRLPLDWKAPLLTIHPLDATLGGLKTKISAQLGVLPGLPTALEIAAAPQPLQPIDLPGGQRISAANFSANSRFRGLLLNTATWQTDLITAAASPVVRFNGQETKFTHARTITLQRGGTLSCVDARFIGEHASFLGNGTIFSNGKAAAVLRIVAPPETTMSIVNQIFPGLKAPPAFSAMSTPQRAALDLEAFGSIGNLQIRLGKNGPLVGAPKPPAPATPP